METVGWCQVLSKENGVEPKRVRIDDTGLGGGVTDRLKELDAEPTAINFGSDPSKESGWEDGSKKYKDARSELAGMTRERFREGTIAIDPEDTELIADLSILKWKPTSDGVLCLMSKKEAKEKLGRSPDHSDSAMLALVPQTVAEGIETGKVSNRGILDYMKERAAGLRKGGLSAAVQKRPVGQVIPEAREILGRQNAAAQDRHQEWKSVL